VPSIIWRKGLTLAVSRTQPDAGHDAELDARFGNLAANRIPAIPFATTLDCRCCASRHVAAPANRDPSSRRALVGIP